ncbi:hypothetical protein KJ611_02025 [Patescibacteria group bacterium]|nr:hypothetical protein [Patescibacteria group bacterium]MBU1705459.1 hypothetical protein [Patescibacteria group bacterium]
MNHSLTLKRSLTIAVAAATILWAAGFASIVAPLTARAASPGDLIKGTTLSTVYYYAADGMRYAFPNEKSYFTWYSDFSGVRTISDSELASISLAGNIVYRPGSRWIKIQSDPKTYAVTPQGQIRWIETEAVATGLAGASWNTFIDDVPDVFFVDYTVGPSLVSAASGYNGMLLEGSTYLLWDGVKRLVSTAGFTANRFQDRFVLPGTGVNLAGISAGAEITGALGALTDTAQTGTVVTGGLSVSLASDTPASATLPGGAASVPFTKVKLMASSGSAAVDQMIWKLGGVGAVGNIDNAYLYEGSARLTNGRSINSSTRKVTFSALGIDLGTGNSSYVTVKGDIAAAPNAGDTANFGLMAAADVSSSATVSGSFPIVGNSMTFSTVEAGTITINETGSIADPTVGAQDAVIAKFTAVTADEDGYLHEITLNVDKAADHSDYKLWEGSDLLSSCESVGNDLVTCGLTNPFFLEEGNSSTFKLSADIGGENGDAIAVGLEENTDVTAVGTDFGFNMGVTNNMGDTGGQCASAADECSYSEVQGGDLTFAFNGPTSDDIQIDGKDQVLFSFAITAENWVEMQELVFTLESVGAGADTGADDEDLLHNGDDEANLQDITIRTASGGTWMGPEELDTTNAGAVSADDITQDVTFNDTQTINAGQSLDLMLTVDVYSGAVVDDVFQATLVMGDVSAEDSNGDAVTDIVPGSDLVGNEFTLADASLAVNATTPPSDATYVKGASAVDVVGFSWEAGDTSDVSITDFTISSVGDDDGEFTVDTDADVDVGDHVTSCSLYDSLSGDLIDGPESPNTNDELLFESFLWTVPGGETMKNVVRCNFSNQDTEGGDDDAYAFYIDSADDITAENEDGDSVDADLGDDNVDGDTTTIVLTNNGDLMVSLDGSTPTSTIVLGSSTGVTVSLFKFEATDEPFTVQKLTLLNCIDYNGDDLCDTFGEDSAIASAQISYKDSAGVDKSKTAYFSGGRAAYSSLDFYVPTTGSRTLAVTVNTNTVSSTGATSGDEFGLALSSDEAEAVTVEFEAVGASSGERLTAADLEANTCTLNACEGAPMTIRKTKPTISLAAGSPSGAGIPGMDEVFRFNVSADSRGYVALNQIAFKVVATDADNSFNACGSFDDASLWDFYDAADSSTLIDDDGDWIFVDEAGDDACGTGVYVDYAILDFTGDTTMGPVEIGAGSTNTYVLEVDTNGAGAADDDAIRIEIRTEDTTFAATGYSAVLWDDDAEADDVDGSYLKNLPVRGGTIQY